MELINDGFLAVEGEGAHVALVGEAEKVMDQNMIHDLAFQIFRFFTSPILQNRLKLRNTF